MSPLALALLAGAQAEIPAAPPPVIQVAPAPVRELPAGDAAKLPAPARALEQAPPEALVRARPRHARGDPLEGLNRRFFRLNDRLDHAVFRPAALGYRHVVPRPVRSGLRNFFANLTEPIVFLNFLLQLKPGKAAETLGRFALNTTVGIGGLVDVAKAPPFKLPHRDNGFGSTLGRYGVGPGPYLYLPFAGPTTLRDLLGGQADRLVLPFTVQQPPFDTYEYQVPKAVITGLDARAEADPELTALFAGAVDPYATLRSVFLQNRAGEIERLRHGGRTSTAPATDGLDDPLADPASPGAARPAPAELADPLADPAAPASAAQPLPSPSPELRDPLADPAATPPAPVPASGAAAPAQPPPAAGPAQPPPAAGPATPARR